MTKLSAVLCLAASLFTGCGSQLHDGIGTPVLISPADGTTISQNPPVFVWHRVEDAIEYNLQVADEPFGSTHTLIVDLLCFPDTNYSPSTTINTGTYYWRAQAIEGG